MRAFALPATRHGLCGYMRLQVGPSIDSVVRMLSYWCSIQVNQPHVTGIGGRLAFLITRA